jgi:hypothetical protein
MPGKKILLFVNKKKQKNFLLLAHGADHRRAPKWKKFFGSFFQKRTLP